MGKHRDDRVKWPKGSSKSHLSEKTVTHLKDLLVARERELRNEIGWRKRSQESHESWIKRYDERILALTGEILDIKTEIGRR